MSNRLVIQGVLRDDVEGGPVPDAAIALLDGKQGEDTLAVVASDTAGAFRFEPPHEGPFRIRAERMGYQTVTSPPFALTLDGTFFLEMAAAPAAIAMDPLTVRAEASSLASTIRLEAGGFLDRRESLGMNGLGIGRFLTREDWKNRNPYQLSDILQDVPGVRIAGSGRRRNVRLRSVTSLSSMQGCVPTFYLNGHKFELRGMSIDEIVSPMSVTAIEVYPGLARPAEFMDMGDDPCGAIVIWTG